MSENNGIYMIHLSIEVFYLSIHLLEHIKKL